MPMSRRPRSDWLGSSTSPPLIRRSNLSSGPMAANAGPAAAVSAREAAPFSTWRRDASMCCPPRFWPLSAVVAGLVPATTPTRDSERSKSAVALIPRPHQRSLERPPVDFLAGEVHGGDAARVADIVERIGVEHQEVGAPAGCDDATVFKPEELCGAARRCDDNLCGRHAGLRHHLEFLLLRKAEGMVFEAGIAAENDTGARGSELRHAPLQDRVV